MIEVTDEVQSLGGLLQLGDVQLSLFPTSGIVRERKPGSVCGSLKEVLITEDLEMRAAIAQLEHHMCANMPDAVQGEKVDAIFPVVHHFAPDLYGREILLKEGSVVIGKLHAHSHLNILAQGHVLVATEDGIEEIKAPCVWTSKAGTKRVVHAIIDSVWVCLHPTDTQDLAQIESKTIAKSYEDIDLVSPMSTLASEA